MGVVGREEELASFPPAAKRVASGEGREVVLIAGEPGQGKTTLVSEIARRAHEDGMTVLLGRCDEEVGSPYRPFHEALTHLRGPRRRGPAPNPRRAHGGELARLVPALQQRLGDLPKPQSTDPDTERYLLYAAAVGLLELASVQTPVLLVLDDLHWVDKPSLQLLRHVVANTSAARLLIFGTYRDAELSASHPLTEALGGLLREPGVSSLHLKGLEDTGVIAFMEEAAGHELDDAGVGLAHQVYRETDGNPFFVAEMLRNLSESGTIYQDDTGRWTADDTEGQLALPHSVRAVIGSRLARLGDDATKVLSTASVIGRDFDLDLLAATTGVDEDDLIDLLDQAQHAALVAEVPGIPGRYSFAHALVQHTLYEDLGGTRRTRLHKAVGEAIEHLYGEPSDARLGELARHFLLATRPTDADKAMSYARRAGEAALTALAPDDAVRYFSQALELAAQGVGVDPAGRIDLLIGLGTAQRQAGIASFRETLLDAARRARELGDTDRLVAAALANNRGWFSSLGQVDTEKVEVIEAALDALPDTDSPERARLLATLCTELIYHSPLERRLALADEAKAIARRLGDRATFVDVVNLCATALAAPSTLATELADFAEAFAAARDLEDPVALLLPGNIGFHLAVRAGQFELAKERLAILRGTAEKLGQPLYLWIDQLYRRLARLAARRHRRGRAARHRRARRGHGKRTARRLCVLRRAAHADPVRAGPDGRAGARSSPTLLSRIHRYPPTEQVWRRHILDAGDEAAARELVDEAAADSFSLPEDNGWFDGIINYARVVIELQLRAHGERLIELLAPFRDQVPHNGLIPHPPVATYLGGLATVVGRFEEAESYFEQAAELNARGEMRFAEAETNLLWGRMLRARNGPGDTDRARSLLEQARESAAARGYAMVERRASAELSKLS